MEPPVPMTPLVTMTMVSKGGGVQARNVAEY